MFSASEISKVSEVEIFKGVYYDVQKKPIANGLLDPKMVIILFKIFFLILMFFVNFFLFCIVDILTIL